MAGLASLTENYTDSEEEETRERDSPEFSGVSGPPSIVDRFLDANESKENTPKSTSSKHSIGSTSNRSTPLKKPTRLVSYGDQEEEDEEQERKDENDSKDEMDLENNPEIASEEEKDKNSDLVPMELDSESESAKKSDADDDDQEKKVEVDEDVISGVHVDAWTEGVKLPPEPAGQCSARLQESINRLWRKRKETGFDTNAAIQNKKAFRNPSIYEKLIEFCGIDEHGTNFPKELYDGHLFGKESYYDEIAKVQKHDMEKREKAKERSATGGNLKSATEAASLAAAAVVKQLEEGGVKRKSKWDQGPPSISIPAFGSLIKKH